jgi:serine/threonine protein phosphatase PrpC
MVQIFTFSEVGGHARNEDALEINPHPIDPASYVCAVADGQGGRAGGAEAARIACQKCLELGLDYSPARLLLPSTWQDIFRKVDKAICDDSIAGFTTLVSFCISESHVAGASNGDSAAVLKNSDVAPIMLTHGQHKNPPLGSGGAITVSFAAALEKPWTVVAMTDGVWKYAGWETVLAIASDRSGEEIIQELKNRARLPLSGAFQDDFTVVVLQP